MNGQVQLIDENEFVQRALKEQWVIPDLVKKEEVPQQVRKEVEALIEKLGSETFDDRRAARDRLREIGAQAVPFLREHRDDPDPEIRIVVRQLLGEDQ